jgi:hypothetical protein
MTRIPTDSDTASLDATAVDATAVDAGSADTVSLDTAALDQAAPAAAEAARAMPAARQHTGAGRVGAVGPFLALALIAAGVVLLHDAVWRADGKPGRSWLLAFAHGLDGFTPQWWLIPAGLAAALIGVWLIIAALRPRSRKTLAVTSATGVFLRTRDIARLASAAADDVDGVLTAHCVAGRRTVTATVSLTADSTDGLLVQQVQEAIARRLAALAAPPTVKIRVRTPAKPREGN